MDAKNLATKVKGMRFEAVLNPDTWGGWAGGSVGIGGSVRL